MQTQGKRILILTPWVPWPVTGACQQDRFFGMLQLKEAGFDIRVIAKIHDFQNPSEAQKAYADAKVPLRLFPHPKSPLAILLRHLPRLLLNWGLFDGAAIEYLDPPYLKAVEHEINIFKPDVLWVEYTTHWAILRWLKSFGIPVVVKSSLNEPKNCVAEHGGTLISRLKSLPKYIGERTAAREADVLLAITPEEEAWYRSLGAKTTGVLPLRGLSRCFGEKKHADKPVLDVVFLSSNYNMGHNRDALRFLLQKIVPAVRKAYPGKFVFHLTGSKFPEHLKPLLSSDVRYEGFIPDLGEFLSSMDIAVCPWISGHGMQQKVFEPLCRGLPLLTTKTAGYPFENGKEVCLCGAPDEYAAALGTLLTANARQRMADAAQDKAKSLFSADAVTRIALDAIEAAHGHSSAIIRS
jgi:hypothetical protein